MNIKNIKPGNCFSCLPSPLSLISPKKKPLKFEPSSPVLRIMRGAAKNDVISNKYHPELDFESHLNIPETRMMTLAGNNNNNI